MAPCINTDITNHNDEIRIQRYIATVNQRTGETTIETDDGRLVTQRTLPGIAGIPSLALSVTVAAFCGEVACKASHDPASRAILDRLFRELGAALHVEGFEYV